jgi:hypothetical protein
MGMLSDIDFNLDTFAIYEGTCPTTVDGLKIFERVLDDTELNVEVNSYVFEDID